MKNRITGPLGLAFSIATIFLCVATAAQAALIFETTDFITDAKGINYSFPAQENHTHYTATLSDLSFAPLSFDYLGLSISTSTQTLGKMDGPGCFTFAIDPGTTYFFNVFGDGGGIYNTGLYGLQVTAAPVPAALGLFASGLIALVAIKRRSL